MTLARTVAGRPLHPNSLAPKFSLSPASEVVGPGSPLAGTRSRRWAISSRPLLSQAGSAPPATALRFQLRIEESVNLSHTTVAQSSLLPQPARAMC